ncbi:hypothetical protein U8335_14285 [Roseiconus lacunae]|uniref:Uncharacterized protein n=1 Tax=Roseiconus lacunae TaxID=2605694 RepID=A0ABT7PPW8_9BACT|nr:hypothetical protein [Roseiconus lacunae]MDM4018334.1 hypothetical protein [Roseiconus lacunae]WRQ53658.1 hypothetical protein U8335_14285 [Stieleria sp. HD01]
MSWYKRLSKLGPMVALRHFIVGTHQYPLPSLKQGNNRYTQWDGEPCYAPLRLSFTWSFLKCHVPAESRACYVPNHMEEEWIFDFGGASKENLGSAIETFVIRIRDHRCEVRQN